jgi:hypothetical protein
MAHFSFARQAGLLAATGCLLLALATGCKKKDPDAPLEMADLGDLKGKVSYNGRPVVHGAVMFFSDKGLVGVAAIEGDGSYAAKLAPGQFNVAVVTTIEPRDARMWAKEGPPGALKGPADKNGPPPPPPIPPDKGGPAAKGQGHKSGGGPYDRLPTLATLLAKMDPADKSTLEAVQKQYGDVTQSGLSVTVERGSSARHDFELK